MTRNPIALALSMTISLALLAPATAFADQGDMSKVNGTLQVQQGERAGDLDTVNGQISIGAKASTGEAGTVNGSIDVGDGAQVGGLSTVNGDIRTGTNVQVGESVNTVNGEIFLGRGSSVQGDVGTVNGAVGLVDTDVSGDIDMVGGDLTVGAGSHVHGGIHYQKPNVGWFSFRSNRKPRIVVGPNARVDGPLVFEREVTLLVHDSARIGPVTGATATSYSGTSAPPRED
ncbi:hypothetical protein ACW7G0_13295 [Lysobacter sp. A286]